MSRLAIRNVLMATLNVTTESAVRRIRGPYKLYSLNPEDECYNARIPRTTKWRRLHCDRDVSSLEENLDHQNSTTDVDEELQSQCSSPSLSLENEDQDSSGVNLKHYAGAMV